MAENWSQELHQLYEFVKTESQAAYAAYCHGVKSKFTRQLIRYEMRIDAHAAHHLCLTR